MTTESDAIVNEDAVWHYCWHDQLTFGRLYPGASDTTKNVINWQLLIKLSVNTALVTRRGKLIVVLFFLNLI